ncbi:MAG: hypothetical protein G01um101449_128 [Parcubacteria group bacterium Gr01-1014_49]|nr:MAG: hypothetical protein G01um101449_128 [Parcubacteria group bacterium Gr01-1014_49]
MLFFYFLDFALKSFHDIHMHAFRKQKCGYHNIRKFVREALNASVSHFPCALISHRSQDFVAEFSKLFRDFHCPGQYSFPLGLTCGFYRSE